jgi:hypothetical protein
MKLDSTERRGAWQDRESDSIRAFLLVEHAQRDAIEGDLRGEIFAVGIARHDD